MLRLLSGEVLLLLALVLGIAATESDIPVLRDLATKKGIFVGSALNYYHLNQDQKYATISAQQFNLITAENGCKWGATEPNQNQFDFTQCDSVFNFATTHQQTFRGHNLCWGVYNPDWLNKYSGNGTELRTILVNHIEKVAGRYKGKVYAWDVVNEAVSDNPSGNNTLKHNIWYPAVPDYIDLAFKTAATVDPKAKLFYNDYSGEGLGAKSDAIYNLVKGMRSRGVPIQGVGLQMHFSLSYSPSPQSIQQNIQRLQALGLEVHITELDVGLNGGGSNPLQQQADVYGNILKVCLAEPACKSYEVWGWLDKYSWRASEDPDYFDNNYSPKPCFYQVATVLSA